MEALSYNALKILDQLWSINCSAQTCIRLGKFSIPAGHNKIQQEEGDLVRRNNGSVGEVHLATRNSTEFQAKQQ
ncbi:hypothetical protein RJ640_003859 [Escallonia rubra]|uniref:Uncharacterized protein n=1 Tax=Escallonia rubra TaxID=112253 RepID=A0AA88U5V2_9ASTE|nr:hypothetical protein RJ640_003859 [Escallonia rubra]